MSTLPIKFLKLSRLNGTPDAYEKGIGYTDLVLQYKHMENYDFKLAFKNIANTRVKVYQRSELLDRNDIFLSYREGVSIMFSATLRM